MKKIILIFLAVLTLCGCQRTEIKEQEVKKPELLSLRNIESLHDAYYEGTCPNKVYVENEEDVEKYKDYGYLRLSAYLGHNACWNRNQVSEDKIQMEISSYYTLLEDIEYDSSYYFLKSTDWITALLSIYLTDSIDETSTLSVNGKTLNYEDIKEHTVYSDDEITIVDFFDYFVGDDAKVDQLVDAEEHAILRTLTYEFICDEFVPLLKE